MADFLILWCVVCFWGIQGVARVEKELRRLEQHQTITITANLFSVRSLLIRSTHFLCEYIIYIYIFKTISFLALFCDNASLCCLTIAIVWNGRWLDFVWSLYYIQIILHLHTDNQILWIFELVFVASIKIYMHFLFIQNYVFWNWRVFTYQKIFISIWRDDIVQLIL